MNPSTADSCGATNASAHFSLESAGRDDWGKLLGDSAAVTAMLDHIGLWIRLR